MAVLQLGTIQAFSQSYIYQLFNREDKAQSWQYFQEYSYMYASVMGRISFTKNLSLKQRLSPENHINLDSLDKPAIAFKNSLPNDFDKNGAPVFPFNMDPDHAKESPWVENIYLRDDGKGGIQVFGVIKLIYDDNITGNKKGTQRIKNIIIISDPKMLKKYVSFVKRLKDVRKDEIQKMQEEEKLAPPPPPPPPPPPGH